MRRADAPSMEPGRGEWRPNDMRLWTKDELLAEIRRLEAWTDDRERLVEENARLREALRKTADTPSRGSVRRG